MSRIKRSEATYVALMAVAPFLGAIVVDPLLDYLSATVLSNQYHGLPEFVPNAIRYFPGIFFAIQFLCVAPLARLLIRQKAFSAWTSVIFLTCWVVGLAAGTTFVYAQSESSGYRPYQPAFYTMTGFAVSGTTVPALLILAAFLGSRAGRSRHLAWPCFLAVACIGAVSCGAGLKFVQFDEPTVQQEALQVVDDPHRETPEPLVDEAALWTSAASLADGPLPFLCTINRTPQILRLAMPKVDLSALGENEVLLPNYAEAIAANQDPDYPLLPSVQMLHYRNKGLSDDFLAAMERYLQQEAPAIGGGKAAFFATLLDEVSAHADAASAATHLAAGLNLSDNLPEGLSPEIGDAVDKACAEFLREEDRSRPIGFYAEHDDLRRIFYQDRFFQKPLGDDAVAALAGALNADPTLRKEYDTILSIQRILNNPPANYSVGDTALFPDLLGQASELSEALAASPGGQRLALDYPTRPKWIALIPHATSRENEFFEQHFLNGLPTENIMNRLIGDLRAGEIGLDVRENSGWYDYKSHALEPLVLPESALEHPKLVLNSHYKKHLIEAFRTMITQNRETHIKAIPPSFALGDKIDGGVPRKVVHLVIAPDLSIEPTATYYLRMGRAFRFVHASLAELLGQDELSSISLPDGQDVHRALRDAMLMNYGYYLQVCDDLGMVPALDQDDVPDHDHARAKAMFEDWRTRLKDDPYLSRDIRSAVPVFVSQQEGSARYWASLGIRMVKVFVQYEQLPATRFQDSSTGALLHQSPVQLAKDMSAWRRTYEFADGYDVALSFQQRAYSIPVEVFAELDGPLKPYTRAEFRALCDTYKSQSAIALAFKEGRRGGGNWTLIVVAASAAALVLVLVMRIRRHSQRR